jgi:hypothetical protein
MTWLAVGGKGVHGTMAWSSLVFRSGGFERVLEHVESMQIT